MPASLPPGEAVPDDGALPDGTTAGRGGVPFGFYVHVPFCATRCGYCDFNTYTASELDGVSRQSYPDAVVAEIRLARRVLGDAELPVQTIFFGGGTPTLLPTEDLGAIVAAIDGEFGIDSGAEVTTEANPESVDPAYLVRLREAGFTRVSFGMQSSSPHVLRVLDRTHTPRRPERCVAWARSAGFARVNLDLIYGAPGETHNDWRSSLDAALAAGPDHISAYALTVEEGTRLATRVRRGELSPPNDDAMAERYVLADETLRAAGLTWYEISNWALSRDHQCRHNLMYWKGADWWGAGPGAHSHVGGTRWWNAKHPATYARRLAEGHSPGHAREVLSAPERHLERIMLELRLADGCRLDLLDDHGRVAARRAVADGLLDPGAYDAGRALLTLRGRLLADAVVRDLT